MRHQRQFILLMAGALALGAMTAPAAFAQPRRAHPVVSNEAPPLTVTRRSFLDYGTQAPVGSMQQYVTAMTVWNRTPADDSRVTHFGGFQHLPGRFGIGGREEPLFTFSTGEGGP